MAEPIPPSAQSSSYSLTTLSSHVSTDRRAVTDMNGKTRTLRCAPFLCRLKRRECCMLGAPSSQPTVPLHELAPARLVIHRQTSAHERRKWTRSVPSRSGILAYLCTGRCVAHHFCAVWGEGSDVCLGPRPVSQRSPYTN